MRTPVYIFACLLLLCPISLAADQYIFLEVEGGARTLHAGEQISVNVTVFNPNTEQVQVLINLVGDSNAWGTMLKPRLNIPAGGRVSTTLYIDAPPTAPAGSYAIGLSAYIVGSPKVHDSASYNFNVAPREEVKIEVDVAKKTLALGDKLLATAVLENSGNILYDGATARLSLVGAETFVVREEKIPLSPKEIREIKYSEDLGKIVADDYSVLVQLVSGGKIVGSGTGTVSIVPQPNIVVSPDTSVGIWHREVTYTIQNKGNTREEKTVSHTFAPLESKFMKASIAPSSSSMGRHAWKMTLAPGETVVLTLSTYGRILYAAYLISALLIAITAYTVADKIVSSPPMALEKNIVGVKSFGDEVDITVSLMIHNLSDKKLSDILLTDSVPKSLEVKKWRLASPSQINERQFKMEYIWSIDEMEPHEERAILYHLRGSPEIKSLPAASIRAKTPVGRTYFTRSEKVEIAHLL